MITEAKLIYALKEMMKTLPLEQINVTLLCERCGCHRQTFYYHYQDIYDLIAALLLNEEVPSFENAKDTKKALKAFVGYVKSNFSFLRSTFNSAARDLTDDFIFGKLNAKFVSLWSEQTEHGMKKEGVRNAARRFSHIVSNEIGIYFKDLKLTPDSFSRKMSLFIDRATTYLLPALFELSRKEQSK